MLEWDPDHHKISFPGLLSDVVWAYTSSRRPGYTKSGVLGRLMGITGWKEGANHEASHVPRQVVESQSATLDNVMHDPFLREAISDQARRQGCSIEEVVENAWKILRTMAADIDYNSVRTMGWLLRKIWRQLFDEIKVDECGLENLRDLANQAKGPLILIPTHRSYIDFLIISYLFFAYNIPIPYVAAGMDFLQIKGMSEMLRKSGAYFIRRSFREDALYSAVFNAYTSYLLQKGHSVEFFLEGTRSRSGKQLSPKMGTLTAILRSYHRGIIQQAHLIPITIDYEKPLELSIHQRELLGEGKIRESLSSLLQSMRVLGQNFGCISVRFGKTISLHPEIEQQKGNNKAVVEALAYQLTDTLVSNAACMPSHLVATILLLYRHGISLSHLIHVTDWLREEIILRGGHTLCVEGASRLEMIQRALKLLGSYVVERRKDLIEPAISNRDQYDNMIGLGYYRNKIIHLFDREGVIAVSLYSHSKSDQQCVDVGKVVDGAVFLTDLLHYEFVRSPVSRMHDDIQNTINRMVERQVLQVTSEKMNIAPTGERIYSLLCSMILPFIDSYWVSVMSLYALCPCKVMKKDEIIRRMMWLAETLYHEHVISHYESCSIETLSNAVTLLVSWNVLTWSESLQELVLSSNYQTEKALHQLASCIANFRKAPISSQTLNPDRLFVELPVMAKL